MPRVETLDDDDALVVADLPVQLPMANIECDDAPSATLQQHVGEAAGGCPDVEALAPPNLDVKRVERVGQLEAAAAGVWVIGREECDRRLIVDRGARLRCRTIVDGHLAGKNQRPRPLTGR